MSDWSVVSEAPIASSSPSPTPPSSQPKSDPWAVVSEKEIARLDLADAFKEGFAANDDVRQRFIASRLLPDVPLSQAVNQVRKTGGQWMYSPDGQSWLPVMGSGIHKGLSKSASAVGDLIPMVTGTAGAVLGAVGAAGPLGAIAGGGAGGGLGEIGRQKLGQIMIGGDITGSDVDANEVMKNAVLNMAVSGGQAAAARIASDAAHEATAQAAQRIAASASLKAKAEALNVPLTVGEVTGDKEALGKQADLGDRLVSGLRLAGWYNSRDRRLANAAQSLVNSLGSKELDPALLSHLDEIATNSPFEIAALRESLEATAPEAWSALKRAFLDKTIGSGLVATKKAAGPGVLIDSTKSTAAKLSDALSDSKTLAKLKAILSDDEWQGLNDLGDVARAASQVSAPSMSVSDIGNIAAEHVKKTAAGYAIGHATGFGPALHIGELVSKVFGEAKAQKLLTSILNGDPETLIALKNLRPISPGSVRWTQGLIGLTALADHALDSTKGQATEAKADGGTVPVASPEEWQLRQLTPDTDLPPARAAYPQTAQPANPQNISQGEANRQRATAAYNSTVEGQAAKDVAGAIVGTAAAPAEVMRQGANAVRSARQGDYGDAASAAALAALSAASLPGGLVGVRGSGKAFYSALEDAAVNAKLGTGTGEQWAGYLRNQPGVTPEEMQWSKLQDYLNSKPKFTREDVAQYLGQNRTNVQEVWKSASPDDLWRKAFDLDEQVRAMQNQYFMLSNAATQECLSRGNETGPLEAQRRQMIREIHRLEMEQRAAAMRSVAAMDNTGYREPGDTKYSQLVMPGGSNYRELLLMAPQNEEQQAYQSKHWDESNVLAHARMNDRVGADGKKTLFIEELQSDWHQKGRDKGYVGQPVDSSGWTAHQNAGGWHVYNGRGQQIATLPEPELTAQQAIEAIADETARFHMVPQAPFKGQAWSELALKRVLKYAADNGYERIAWTPGSVQVARYPKAPGGLKTWYDDTLPTVAQKLVKKYGMRVGQSNINGVGNAWSVDLTPQIKGQSFPLYMEGGRVERPVRSVSLPPLPGYVGSVRSASKGGMPPRPPVLASPVRRAGGGDVPPEELALRQMKSGIPQLDAAFPPPPPQMAQPANPSNISQDEYSRQKAEASFNRSLQGQVSHDVAGTIIGTAAAPAEVLKQGANAVRSVRQGDWSDAAQAAALATLSAAALPRGGLKPRGMAPPEPLSERPNPIPETPIREEPPLSRPPQRMPSAVPDEAQRQFGLLAQQLNALPTMRTARWPVWHDQLHTMMAENGFEEVGRGAKAVTFVHKDGDVAAKYFQNDQGYQAFVHLAQQNPSPYFPKIYGVTPLNGGNNLAVMEALQPLDRADMDRVTSFIHYFYDRVGQGNDVAFNLSGQDEEVPRALMSLSQPEKTALDVIANGLKGGPEWADLHEGNIMKRKDGTLVVTDPYYPQGSALPEAANPPVITPQRMATLATVMAVMQGYVDRQRGLDANGQPQQKH